MSFLSSQVHSCLFSLHHIFLTIEIIVNIYVAPTKAKQSFVLTHKHTHMHTHEWGTSSTERLNNLLKIKSVLNARDRIQTHAFVDILYLRRWMEYEKESNKFLNSLVHFRQTFGKEAVWSAQTGSNSPLPCVSRNCLLCCMYPNNYPSFLNSNL